MIFKDDKNGIMIDLQTNDKIQKAKEMNGRYNRSLGAKGLSIESLGMKSRSVNGYLKFKKKQYKQMISKPYENQSSSIWAGNTTQFRTTTGPMS